MTLIDKIELSVIDIQDKLKQPYFRIGDILEIDSELSIFNRILADQNKKFPFVYMRTDYTETEVIQDKEYESDITLFIVNTSSSDNNTAELRRENEIPELATMATDLLKAIQSIGKIGFEENEKQYKYYNSDENELNTPVNIVQIQINTAQYQLNEC